MKIEWLNDEFTEAIVTRGWLLKERAHVSRCADFDGVRWKFVATGRRVSWFVGSQLESWRTFETTHGREWVRIEQAARVPAARLIERKP